MLLSIFWSSSFIDIISDFDAFVTIWSSRSVTLWDLGKSSYAIDLKWLNSEVLTFSKRSELKSCELASIYYSLESNLAILFSLASICFNKVW